VAVRQRSGPGLGHGAQRRTRRVLRARARDRNQLPVGARGGSSADRAAARDVQRRRDRRSGSRVRGAGRRDRGSRARSRRRAGCGGRRGARRRGGFRAAPSARWHGRARAGGSAPNHGRGWHVRMRGRRCGIDGRFGTRARARAMARDGRNSRGPAVGTRDPPDQGCSHRGRRARCGGQARRARRNRGGVRREPRGFLSPHEGGRGVRAERARFRGDRAARRA
jgi:hypothetical protein